MATLLVFTQGDGVCLPIAELLLETLSQSAVPGERGGEKSEWKNKKIRMRLS